MRYMFSSSQVDKKTICIHHVLVGDHFTEDSVARACA